MSTKDIRSPYHWRAVKARADQLGDVETADRASTELRAVKLEIAIRETVDAAPPLTQEQRDRLAALLRPTVL